MVLVLSMYLISVYSRESEINKSEAQRQMTSKQLANPYI